MSEFIDKHLAEIISAIGACGSVVGAIVAWVQYRKAAKSAQGAKNSEMALLDLIKRNEMSQTMQKVRDIVGRLSKYTQRGGKYKGNAGLSLTTDIEKAISLRHELASVRGYSAKYGGQLNRISTAATSIDFKVAPEDDRVDAITTIIDGFNEIAVQIDNEVSVDD